MMWATPDECAELLLAAEDHPETEPRRYSYSTIVPLMWLQSPELESWKPRFGAATGLPVADMTEPLAFVGFRPGDRFPARHTAFDLTTPYGRVTCRQKQGRQRYAEALLALTAPADGGGTLTFANGLVVPPVVGQLTHWLGADEGEARIPGSAHAVQECTVEWAWYLMARWRRPVAGLRATPAESRERVAIWTQAGRDAHAYARTIVGDAVRLIA